MEEIVAQGAVVSEFPMGAEPKAGHFPTRNRITAGLSRGVLVVEAREDSGVFSTVNWALEQGKDVFAVAPDPLRRRCLQGAEPADQAGSLPRGECGGGLRGAENCSQRERQG
jgi:DNA processing protein